MVLRRISVITIILKIVLSVSYGEAWNDDNHLRRATTPRKVSLESSLSSRDALSKHEVGHRRLSLSDEAADESNSTTCASKIFLCEVSGEFGTMECVPSNNETKIECNNYCDDATLNALEAFETSKSAEEAANTIEFNDLELVVQRTSTLVDNEYKTDITDESIVKSFYPDGSTNLTLIGDLGMANSSNETSGIVYQGEWGSASDAKKREDRQGRMLQMCGSRCWNDHSLAGFFSNKPKGCFAATSVMLSSVLDLPFSFLQLNGPTSLGTKVTWQLIMDDKNEPMFAHLFDEYMYRNSSLTLSDESNDPVKLGFSLVGYLFRYFGVNSIWCSMSESMTTAQIVRSGCSTLLHMAAVSATNGAILYQGEDRLETDLLGFFDSYAAWEEDCFGIEPFENDPKYEEEEPGCVDAEQPDCSDGDLCTKDSLKCDASTSFKWVCENTQLVCANPNESCDPLDGMCKGECTATAPDCNDNNLCTQDRPNCNATTNFDWQCENVPMVCSNPDESCDPFDGLCKTADELTPCVAVVDEDDDFRAAFYQEKAWKDFRRDYPDRPFCLLVPAKKGGMKIPPAFLSDSRTTLHYDITRDGGDVSKADDWITLCGLGNYTAANVNWVGLFVDNSGSLKETQVVASRDKFYKGLEERGIEVKKVVNGEENWIKPFMTTLVP